MPRVLRNVLLVLLLVVLVAWTVWPIATVAIAGSIASANGCRLDEGSVHPCVVNGRDIGEQLYGMGVMGWFMLVTVPTGLAGLALYGLVLLAVWILRRSRRRRESTPAT